MAAEVNMDPIATLMHEHDVILLVAQAAAREAQKLQAGGPLDPQRVEQILDFVRTFADSCHHGKEEDLLFARLEERGFSREMGPVAVMLFEHEQGRRFVQQASSHLSAAAAGDENALRHVAAGLSGWAELIQQHIYKENNVLFPMAQQVLSGEDLQELAAAFQKVEAERFAQAHERYHQLAHQLAGH
jgi:hemerythrin-like domain-containing protein